jgi:hypothetical protein
MIATKKILEMICSACQGVGHNKNNKMCPKKMMNVSDILPAPAPKAPKKTKRELELERLSQPDLYTSDILRRRFRRLKEEHDDLCQIKASTGLPIRHQNPPEDITENIAKFVIQNYDGDSSCKWAKSVGLNGDLCSDKYPIDAPPEVKSFSSCGPLTFGPDKKFSVVYFVDIRNLFEHDNLVVWKANLTSESPEWKGIKMTKDQTFDDQCKQGRRPHLGWSVLYPQISENCVKIYDGTFEGIFTPAAAAAAAAATTTTTTTDDYTEQDQSTVSQ